MAPFRSLTITRFGAHLFTRIPRARAIDWPLLQSRFAKAALMSRLFLKRWRQDVRQDDLAATRRQLRLESPDV